MKGLERHRQEPNDEQLRGDWPVWRRYRDMRARTSHTYAAAAAEQVVAGIPDFLADALYLCDQLRRRLQ